MLKKNLSISHKLFYALLNQSSININRIYRLNLLSTFPSIPFKAGKTVGPVAGDFYELMTAPTTKGQCSE